MVGNNEDSWRHTAQISFVPATNGRYGVAYVGYSDKTAADGGVNEYGLAFDGFTMPHKPHLKEADPGKKDFTFQQIHLVLEKCKNVQEAYSFLLQYNLQLLNGSPLFNGGMVLFIDANGEYLTLEADTMMLGNNDKLVLANFSPSATKDLNTIKIERYCKGVQFLSNKLDTSLAFCTALSDTMSVCRNKVGDGTLYTSIYNLNEGLIYLYFFHDFQHVVTFNIKEELAKGKHAFPISQLFPPSEAYNKFIHYKTPQNNLPLKLTLLILCAIFLFTTFHILYLKARRKTKAIYAESAMNKTMWFFAALSVLLCYYCFILLRHEAIFYFPSPYQDYHFSIITIMAYTPFLLLLAAVPMIVRSLRMRQSGLVKPFTKNLLLLNNLLHALLIGLFVYWHFFNVFS